MQTVHTAIGPLLTDLGLHTEMAQKLSTSGNAVPLSSSFAVCTAAQASIAAAALAAAQVGRLRGLGTGSVSVDLNHAALECLSYFEIDGIAPNLWDQYSGAYRCADGWVRIHANFAHHREGALAVLGLKPGDDTPKTAVEAALKSWRAEDFESACAERGLVVAALRTHSQWLAHEQSQAVATQPLVDIKSIATNVESTKAERIFWQKNTAGGSKNAPNRPLEGLKVLELTRILAGPVAGRALAAYGADVLLVNGPHLPNIDAIADTSRGKRSAHVDLRTAHGRETLQQLVREADVFIQGYAPAAIARWGFGPADLAALNPRIVSVSLSAYGQTGPWANRRGFDSLVQTATGLNADESDAAGVNLAQAAPKTLPMQILDHASGYLMAAAACALLLRQRQQGAGAMHAHVSLARTAQWLRSLGRVDGGLAVAAKPAKELVAPYLYTEPSGFGQLTALSHSASFDGIRAGWHAPSMPPGTHLAAW